MPQTVLKTYACRPWKDVDATYPCGAPIVLSAETPRDAILEAAKDALERGLTWSTITVDEIVAAPAAGIDRQDGSES